MSYFKQFTHGDHQTWEWAPVSLWSGAPNHWSLKIIAEGKIRAKILQSSNWSDEGNRYEPIRRVITLPPQEEYVFLHGFHNPVPHVKPRLSTLRIHFYDMTWYALFLIFSQILFLNRPQKQLAVIFRSRLRHLWINSYRFLSRQTV